MLRTPSSRHFLFRTFLLFFLLIPALFAREINIDSLAKKAALNGKHLLVWLHRTDCGYCESMREFTLDDERVKAMLDTDFLFEHIDIMDKDTISYRDFKGNGRQFARKVGYSIYPSSVFFDKTGEIIFAAPGYIEEGPFLTMLQFIQSQAYEKQGYDCFRRQQEHR